MPILNYLKGHSYACMRLLRLADPAGSHQRAKRKLKRRTYKSKVIVIMHDIYVTTLLCSVHRDRIMFGIQMVMTN